MSFKWILAAAATSSLISTSSVANDLNPTERLLKEKQEQQEAERRLSDTQPPITTPDLDNVPTPLQETPCFDIKNIELDTTFHRDLFDGITPKFENQCLGRNGISLYLKVLNKRLLQAGYVTSRAVLPEQDLSTGTLNVKVYSGALASVEFPDTYQYSWRFAAPLEYGKPLNIRDMEQAIEQYNRLASQSVKFDILPGEEVGTSKLRAKAQQGNQIYGNLAIDDAGSEATGKYQLSASANIDNLVGIQDRLSFGGGRDLDRDSANGSYNYRLGWEVPLGYWLLSTRLTGSDYTQAVNGAVQDFVSSGDSHDEYLTAKYLVNRDNNSKLTMDVELRKRSRAGYINDTEVKLQKRRLTDIKLSLLYKYYGSGAVYDMSFSAYQGLDWFGAEQSNDSNGIIGSDYRYFTASLLINTQFSSFAQKLNYSAQVYLQKADTQLYTLDWFSNGSRYTVRGYESKNTVSAADGWRIRNDLAYPLRETRTSLYIGFDIGGIDGEGASNYEDDILAGLSLGVKGAVSSVGFDFTISQPVLYKPENVSDCCALAGRISWSF